MPLPEGGERSGREGAVMTAAEVSNVEDARLLALMLEGRDHEPKNGGCFMDFSRQPPGASAAHTFPVPVPGAVWAVGPGLRDSKCVLL